MSDVDAIKGRIKDYIMEEFLPGESPDTLTDDTEMVTDGVLDSLATLRLVEFLEGTFGVSLEPHEVDAEYLNTLPDIANLVAGKLG